MLPAKPRAVPGVDARYVYAQGPRDAIYVNLYVSSGASFRVAGKDLRCRSRARCHGAASRRSRCRPKDDVKGAIKLRIPGWARNQPAPGGLYSYADRIDAAGDRAVNGKSVTAAPDKLGYVSLDRSVAERRQHRRRVPRRRPKSRGR